MLRSDSTIDVGEGVCEGEGEGWDEGQGAEARYARICVPPEHDMDPFACPCCANVFREIISANDTQLHSQLPGACLPEARTGSVLLRNAKIMTMQSASPNASSMWVENGKIKWIGETGDVPAEAGKEDVIDCQGKVVLPGFIDPHMHLAPLAMLRDFANIGPFRFPTVDQAVAELARLAKSTPAGEWIVGRQFDPSLQTGADALTRTVLDGVSTEHPIFVYNASLHLAYCNSLALEIGDVTQRTPDPHGAEIGRDEHGIPNGVLKAGPAMALVARHNPRTRDTNLAEACLDVFGHANSLGITLLCDQGTGLFQGAKELDLYRNIRQSNRMTTRFRYSLSQVLAHKWDEIGARWGEGDEWLRNSGWKIVSDGSNQGRTGLQREAFVGSQETGIAYIEVDELNAAVAERVRQGWAVCVHANGDLAIDRVLDAFTLARDQGLDPGALRCRIEHCSILHDEQIDRMAALGISPSFLIGHVHYWGLAFVHDVFGLEKAEKLDRTAACEARGIRWTIHSDDPVTEMNPLRCIENAVTRTMWRSDDKLAPRECISVEAALRAMTIDAAWQCHADHEVGSLEVGKFADFVVLDEDPTQVDPGCLSQIQVNETWVNGAQVYARS
jgi:predicted amidohydrolase YtcJ